MDFAEDRLSTSRKMIALQGKEEATSFGHNTTVQRSFKEVDVKAVLDKMVAHYAAPKYIRSDNGGQLIAHVARRWTLRRLIALAFVQPGKPWKSDLQILLLARIDEIAHRRSNSVSRRSPQDLEHVASDYNAERPHSRHNYRPLTTAFKKIAVGFTFTT